MFNEAVADRSKESQKTPTHKSEKRQRVRAKSIEFFLKENTDSIKYSEIAESPKICRNGVTIQTTT